MKPEIRAADAPGYTVVTFTTVFESFGYCRIGSTIAARKPINRISRLTTTDSTGRLMKISVHDIAWPQKSVARRLRRNRRRRIGRDRHSGAGLQLELAERDHAVTGLQTLENLGAAVDAIACLHEGARGNEAGLAVLGLLLLDQEHGIAIERVVD